MAEKDCETNMCDLSGMVCLEEVETKITVYDTTPCAAQKRISLVVRPRYTVGTVFSNVTTQFSYDSFELVLQLPNQGESIYLNDKKDQILYEIPGFIPGNKNTLVLMPPGSWENNPKKKIEMISPQTPVTPDPLSDDDLALGASASPTEPELETPTVIPTAPALPMFDTSESASTSYKLKIYSSPRPVLGYVGLVNQAMTCYLNSLLQALFMTPEFRNALYKREFNINNEVKSVPFQLQKLFLNLQTSQKVAVETTDLTGSFGWDSSEAWQQHDIQELCRVMFDALEKEFANTKQADLINRLYEGKMTDYVKCLECCTEKSREDTFLDIPLPVRPFGSTIAYGSIEEALRAFVQPETLDGNNQYFCEKCNKKCDAHKGLKFKKFPYILTLHLKRFDFDYNTLHRIKLNDKVTFPQTLNLNCFVNVTDAGTFPNQNHAQTNGFVNVPLSDQDSIEPSNRCDDSSTTDSGAALEEDNCSGTATTASSSHHENDLQEDDEGIDMGNGPDLRNGAASMSGPYVYELFAIMIHSGSASGGHYYAYIKEFENGNWFCFNDQSVSAITQEDIQKSFGGGSFKAYYSGAYGSSTNAYMLMYRQMDSERNENAMKADDFPEYITKLLEHLNDKEQEDKKVKAVEQDVIKPKIFFYNPKLKQMKEKKVYVGRHVPLESVLETAHTLLDVHTFAPVSRCRLVAYNYATEEIEYSLENRDHEGIEAVINSLPTDSDFLLETRQENETFEVYEPGGVTVKVFKVDLKTADLEGPYFVRAIENGSVPNLKKTIAKKLGVKFKDIIVVLASICSDVTILKDEIGKLFSRSKLFVTIDSTQSEDTAKTLKKITQDNFTYLTFIYLTVPNTDKATLESLAIPPYEPTATLDNTLQTPKQSPSEIKNFEGGDVVDAVMLNGASSVYETNHIPTGGSGDYKNRSSPLPPSSLGIEGGGGGGTESNSEDSSLSDGDRTLVESAQHDLSNVSSTSQSPQLSSPEDDSRGKKGRRLVLAHEVMCDDDEYFDQSPNYYFRAIPVNEDEFNTNSYVNGAALDLSDCTISKDSSPTSERTYKVIVDKRMKVGALKLSLEPHLCIPCEYFKLIRKPSGSFKHEEKQEYTNLTESLSIFRDGDVLSIELGRNLKKGELKAKIYFLKLSDLNNETSKLPVVCDWIFKIGIKVIDAKRELVAHLLKIDATKYRDLTVENCRLWEKSGKNPVRILQNDKTFGGDVAVSIHSEMVLQILECSTVPSTDEDTLTLFVRLWSPSKFELGEFQEITLDKNTDIRVALSSLSGIPEEKISYTKVTSSFPCTNVRILSINSMSWFQKAATTEAYPLKDSQNGNVYFYKDNTESTKELTIEERRELDKSEKARLERLGGISTTTYSPRRERALKIYLDSSPTLRGE